MTRAAVAALCLLACGAGCRRMLPLANPFHRPAGEPEPERAAVVEAEAIDLVEEMLAERRWEGAEARIDELLARDADHPRLFFVKGRLHQMRGEPGTAIGWYDRSIAASPAWIEPRLRLAACYMEEERPAAAADVFRDIDRLFPEHPAGPCGRGICQLRRERVDAARDLLDRALERDADYPYALRGRAQVAALDGDEDLERRLLLRYAALVPEDPWAHARLGRIHESRGMPARARRSYRRSFELRPDQEVATRLLALAERAGDRVAANRWRACVPSADGARPGDPAAPAGAPVDSPEATPQFAVPR